ncbi:hypothetical protein Mnod_2968 [Methylobacterium nodulans ORS 2060]|uniref:Uncharacterized protein n=1 Tax=Methylobacterium nodulans (strain LMG 21967 / CNCM I-2342 / ORS 2060) TaxID=460265 RepID=B8II49_METNO|nr:hypothetical protein Mnod_2968 [Methylobacterium nodulans ORS 2060]
MPKYPTFPVRLYNQINDWLNEFCPGATMTPVKTGRSKVSVSLSFRPGTDDTYFWMRWSGETL